MSNTPALPACLPARRRTVFPRGCRRRRLPPPRLGAAAGPHCCGCCRRTGCRRGPAERRTKVPGKARRKTELEAGAAQAGPGTKRSVPGTTRHCPGTMALEVLRTTVPADETQLEYSGKMYE